MFTFETIIMFRKEKSIGINSSASHLCKNLSLLVKPDKRQISYAVIHKYTVNIVTASTDGTNVSERQLLCKEPSSAGSTFLMQVKNRICDFMIIYEIIICMLL